MTTNNNSNLTIDNIKEFNCFEYEDYNNTDAFEIYECPMEIDLYYSNETFSNMTTLYEYSHKNGLPLYISFVTLV